MAAKPRSASKRSQRTKLPPMQEASSEPPLSRERIV
ncbi:TetR family transcriptional regulator, partial [Mesorhizobium sp. M7A.F.Ca.MR.148.00.0.0]